MVRKSRRKRSIKNKDKQAEIAKQMSFSDHEKYHSPIRNSIHGLNHEVEFVETNVNHELPYVQQPNSQTLPEVRMTQERHKSPLPHEIYKASKSTSGEVCIYDLSPHAVEKRELLKARRQENDEIHKSGIIPKVLELSENLEVSNNIPLLLNKSMSEGYDPFEWVRQSLSNGTLTREKVFSKIKRCENIQIGGNLGSSFGPYIKSNVLSERTASSSLDSNQNEDQNKRDKSIGFENQVKMKQGIADWRSSKWNQANFKNLDTEVDQDLLDYLDQYPTHILQKTAILLIEKSLSRSKSFKQSNNQSLDATNSQNFKFNDPENIKNEEDTENLTDFKPCNCRKSKCLKLYWECFSNGRKCTPKCDCSNCWNTTLHENLIHKAKEQIMNRNPDAFKPKFNEENNPK